MSLMSDQRQPIRVLHLIDSLAPGGAERMLVELVNNFDFNSITPVVCVTRHALTLKPFINPNINVFCLDRKATWDLKAIRAFGEIVKEEKVQIIHAHGYSSFRFACASRALSDLPVKIIVHAHSSDPPDFLTSLIGSFSLDYFIGTSMETIHWAEQKMHLPANKFVLFENAIDPKPYQKARKKKVDHLFSTNLDQIGIMIANIRPVKDLITLFRSLAISKNKEKIGIIIAGSVADENYFKTCTDELTRLSLQNHVIFQGYSDDIPALLAGVDFGVLSSERETGPIALLEYMAAGIPFVVTCAGQVANEVSKIGIPGCVPIKDPQAFAQALDVLIGESQEARDIRVKQAFNLANEKFNIHHQIKNLISLYQKILID